MPIRLWMFNLRLQLDRLQVRERLLLLGVLVLVLVMLTEGLLWATGLNDHSDQEARIESLQEQFSANQEALTMLEQARNSPSAQALAERNARLRDELKALDDRINQVTEVLIPPNTMVTLLRELLTGNNLTLKSLDVEPPTRVEADSASNVTLYRHQMIIELQGEYSALEGYLKSIETLPWQLFWDELSIEIDNYPTLDIRLRVHTLSDREEWLNV